MSRARRSLTEHVYSICSLPASEVGNFQIQGNLNIEQGDYLLISWTKENLVHLTIVGS